MRPHRVVRSHARARLTRVPPARWSTGALPVGPRTRADAARCGLPRRAVAGCRVPRGPEPPRATHRRPHPRPPAHVAQATGPEPRAGRSHTRTAPAGKPLTQHLPAAASRWAHPAPAAARHPSDLAPAPTLPTGPHRAARRSRPPGPIPAPSRPPDRAPTTPPAASTSPLRPHDNTSPPRASRQAPPRLQPPGSTASGHPAPDLVTPPFPHSRNHSRGVRQFRETRRGRVACDPAPPPRTSCVIPAADPAPARCPRPPTRPNRGPLTGSPRTPRSSRL